jgi:hypothetical protein
MKAVGTFTRSLGRRITSATTVMSLR